MRFHKNKCRIKAPAMTAPIATAALINSHALTWPETHHAFFNMHYSQKETAGARYGKTRIDGR